MKTQLAVLAFCISVSIQAKEYKSKRALEKETNSTELLPSDWLKSDRLHNTSKWQNANNYNLINNRPNEYSSLFERRDFYKWLSQDLRNKGHEVLWVSMAQYITHKLRLVKSFPYKWFTHKDLQMYTETGSESVFRNAFPILIKLYFSNQIFQNEDALQWDKKILHEEQFVWLPIIYSQMDSRIVRKIDRMAKGEFLYGLLVPKRVRFKGNISDAEDRYDYALNVLRNYCQSRLE